MQCLLIKLTSGFVTPISFIREAAQGAKDQDLLKSGRARSFEERTRAWGASGVCSWASLIEGNRAEVWGGETKAAVLVPQGGKGVRAPGTLLIARCTQQDLAEV